MSGPPPAQRLRFRRTDRILRSDDFENLLKSGARIADERITLWAQPNGLQHSRFGLIVGRRFGGAVQRNVAKRRLREAWRLSRARVPAGLDVACSPRPGASIQVAAAIESLVELTHRLARRLARP